MTAEIAIMNRNGIALAADSAVTVSAEGINKVKVFDSANKLFALSGREPIGIMFYGNGSILGVPWETIVKMYRKELGDDVFEHVEDYTDSFLKFITSGNFFSQEEQYNFIYTSTKKIFSDLNMEILDEIKDLVLNQGKTLTKEDVDKIYEQKIESRISFYQRKSKPLFSEKIIDVFIDECSEVIFQIAKDIFPEDIMKDSKIADKIIFYAFFYFLNDDFSYSKSYSGLVFAGFGSKEIFPSLIACKIDGFVSGNPRVLIDKRVKIDSTNPVKIIPFAQSEMVERFLYGLDFQTIKDISGKGLVAFSKKAIKKYKDSKVISRSKIKDVIIDEVVSINRECLKLIQENIIRSAKWQSMSIESAVGFLPKDKLAEMAEHLISLTSLKRKTSYYEDDSVGGPVDVALISKIDGFVWIKRKHYFEAELNHHFFANYFHKYGISGRLEE